ncbi:J domain-containing protein [Nitratifractor sp.]|uniref:J domain-containing protein n=1 Tax=Nitratifractor sp. TaxID=2268144 RepID=UPI0025E872B1|nr:J domain-containing protein [Nitratifractor sp.]
MKSEIRKALETLGLPPMVTREEIKKRYRQLARRHHPDREAGDAERMEAINRAYETLMEYVENFRFRFDEEEIAQQNPEAHHSGKFKF